MTLFFAALLASTAYACGRWTESRSADTRLREEGLKAYHAGQRDGWRTGYRLGWLDNMVEQVRIDNRDPADCDHARVDVIAHGATQCLDCLSWVNPAGAVDPMDAGAELAAGVDPLDEPDAFTNGWYARHPGYRGQGGGE